MKKFMVAAVALAALMAAPAQARTHISVGFYAPAPIYYEPAPVYYAPPPVVYYPPINRVYYSPPCPRRYGYGVGYSSCYGYRNEGRHRRYDTAWNGRSDDYGDTHNYRNDRGGWHR